MKLLILHVASYNDAPLVRRTWDAIIDESECVPQVFRIISLNGLVIAENQPQGIAVLSSALEAEIIGLAKRFYPSETAFPLGQHLLISLSYAYILQITLPGE